MLNKEKPVQITIDEEKCIKCQACVNICPDYLEFVNNEIKIKENSTLGCIQCGNCMMQCPKDCIKVKGDYISPDNVFYLSENTVNYDSLQNFFHTRRSIRKFKKQEISQEILEKIIDSASTAPIGLPPSEVKVLVINGENKVQAFAEDLVEECKNVLKKINPIALKLMQPFMKKSTECKIFNDFILPLLRMTVDERAKGNDILFYNAPAVMIFYSTEYGDKEEAAMISSYATLAAETLGLGTCYIGSVAEFLNRSKKLKQKYGLQQGEKAGLAFILGYPDINYNKGIKRKLAEVKYL